MPTEPNKNPNPWMTQKEFEEFFTHLCRNETKALLYEWFILPLKQEIKKGDPGTV